MTQDKIKAEQEFKEGMDCLPGTLYKNFYASLVKNELQENQFYKKLRNDFEEKYRLLMQAIKLQERDENYPFQNESGILEYICTLMRSIADMELGALIGIVREEYGNQKPIAPVINLKNATDIFNRNGGDSNAS